MADVPNQPIAPAKPRRWRRLALRLAMSALLVVAGCYLSGCIALYFFQDQMLYPRDYAPRPQVGVPPGVEEWQRAIPASEAEGGRGGGKVVAWFAPAAGASAEHPAPVVVYCHGNAEIIDQQHDAIAMFHSLGWSVLLPEYRGYGRDAGTPSEAAIQEDMLAFYDRLVARPDVDKNRLVYYGHSLGGGVVAQLAGVHPPRGVILESSFDSVAAMAHEFWMPSFLVNNPYRTDEALRRIDVPVLMFHGTGDRTIPIAHARRLHGLLPNSELIEYGGDHNSFPPADKEEDYRERVAEFLRRCRGG